MNTDVLFSSSKTDWETPDELFKKYHEMYKFTLDVCANAKNHKLEKYLGYQQNGEFIDALSETWTGRCFMNPPYGRKITGIWMKKAFESVLVDKTAELVCSLVPARTDNKWFHTYVWDDEVGYFKQNVYGEFLQGRVCFLDNGVAGDAAPFPSMIVVYDGTFLDD